MKKTIFAVLILATALAACRKTVETRPGPTTQTGHLKVLPDSGLIALYEFNGNVNDGSGNGNHGTIHGTVTYCNDRFGVPNHACHFNGADSNFITTVTGGPLGNTPRSVCFWVRSSSFSMQYLVSYGDIINAGHCFGTGLNNPCPGIGFDNGLGVAMRGNDSLLDGAWHQLVIVFDAMLYGPTIDDGLFYIDGELSNVINCAAYLGQMMINTYAGCPFTIGSDLNGGRVLNGDIDDIRIYNRALTDTEIFQLFIASNPVPTWEYFTECNNTTGY